MIIGAAAAAAIGRVAGPTTQVYSVNSANLNGSTQYFNAGNPAELQFSTGMTWNIWIKFASSPSGNVGILDKVGATTGTRAYQLYYNSVVGLRFTVFTGAGGPSDFANIDNNSATYTDWNMLSMTHNGSTLEAYINGATVGSTGAGTIASSTNDCLLGALTGGTSLLSGNLSFAWAWDRGLSSAEITELYNATAGADTPKCYGELSSGLKSGIVYAPRLSNWTGNTGQELTDQSTSGITTTNVGSTPFTGTGLSVECT